MKWIAADLGEEHHYYDDHHYENFTVNDEYLIELTVWISNSELYQSRDSPFSIIVRFYDLKNLEEKDIVYLYGDEFDFDEKDYEKAVAFAMNTREQVMNLDTISVETVKNVFDSQRMYLTL